MTASVTDAQFEGRDDGAGTFETPVLTPTGADRVIYVLTTAGDGSPAEAVAVKYASAAGVGGESLTKFDSTRTFLSPYVLGTLWKLVAPSAASGTIWVDNGTASEMTAMAVALQDADGTETVTFAFTSNDTAAAVVAASVAGELVLSMGSVCLLSPSAATLTSGDTSIAEADGALGANYHSTGASYEVAAGATTTLSWSSSNNGDWGLFGISVGSVAGSPIKDLAATAQAVATATANLSVSGVIHKPNNVISGGSGWAVVGGASAAAVLGDTDPASYMRLILDGAEVPLVMDALPTPIPAGTGIRRWHARVNNGLGEVKLTLMDSANTPLGDSGWVAASSTMTAYSSAITISSTATRFKIEGRKTTITGLDFPSNVTGSDTAAPFVAMQYLNPHANGLPIWGTGSGAARTGATYIWKYRPRQQTGYYVTMWWSNNGSFLWDGGGSNTYYGGHPYPQNSANTGTTHWWETAGGDSGADLLLTLAGTNRVVIKDVWHTQAMRVIVNGDGSKTIRFYLDLPNLANNDIMQKGVLSTWGETNPPSPALTFGDSPWYASFQHERMSGIFRGLKIFSRTLSEAEMLTEAGADPVVTSGIWYSNINPTPDDITDKSGQGHHFIWADPANKATLWTP